MQAVTAPSTLDPLTLQLGASVLICHAMELIKTSKIPWLTTHTSQLNSWVAILSAFFTTIGISAVVSGSFQAGSNIQIVLPPATVLFSNLLRFFVQVGAQKLYYKVAVKPTGIAGFTASINEPAMKQ